VVPFYRQNPLRVLLLILVVTTPIAAESWSDLDEHASRKIYGSEKDQKFPVRTPLFSIESWEEHYSIDVLWLYRYTSYPKFKSHRFLFSFAPIWYNLKSKTDNRSKGWLFPLFYKRSDREERLLLSPLGFYHRDGMKKNSSLFYLFYAGSNGADRSRYSALFPLYFHRKSESQNGQGVKTVTNQLLSALYSSTKTQECAPDCRTVAFNTFFPIVPFLYFSTSNPDRNGAQRNILSLIHLKTDHGKLERFWIIPAFFWNNSDGKRYLHVLPPLFMSFSHGPFSYSHLFPVYLRYRQSATRHGLITPLFQYSRKDDTRRLSLLYPLFYRKTVAGKTGTVWLPFAWYKRDSYFHLFPLYVSFQNGETKTAIAPLYFSRKSKTAERKLYGILWKSHDSEKQKDSLALFPLYFSFRNGDTKTAIAPFYFSRKSKTAERKLYGILWKSHDSEKQTSSLHLFPFLFHHKIDRENEAEKRRYFSSSYLTPLFYYKKRDFTEPNTGDEIATSRFIFPYLGFSRNFDSREGTDYKFLFLYDYRKDQAGKLNRLWIFPVAFYKRESYFHLFPLFFRPNAKDAPSGVSFGPLHYHRWSPDVEKRWVLLHYGNYSKRSDRFTSLYFPFYYAWKRENNSGKIVLPGYFEYEDKTKSIQLVVAYWNQKQGGYLKPDASIGRRHGRWYLDGSVSFLYNLFSMESRVSFRVPEKHPVRDRENPLLHEVMSAFNSYGGEQQPESESSNHVEKPSIRKKGGLSRENATNYFGWSALYGILSYARADTARHFRMLPLGWFTWDTASNDRVILLPPVLPLYVHYRSEDLEYRVIVPLLYGKQRNKKSFIESYFLFGFLREYDDETKKREYSILWPLINFYRSPDQSGGRFLPLFHYRSTWKDSTRTSRLITPLFYSKAIEIHEPGTEQEAPVIKKAITHFSPLHYRSMVSDDRGANVTSKFLFPLVPIYYHSTNEIRERAPPIRPVRAETTPPRENTRRIESSYLFPLYYSKAITTTDGTENRRLFYTFIPLYIRWSDRQETHHFVAGLHIRTTPSGNKRFNFLYLFERESDVEPENKTRHDLLFRALHFEKSPQTRTVNLLYHAGFYYRKKLATSDYRFDVLASLYGQKREGSRFSWHLFPFLFYAKRPDQSSLFAFGLYRKKTPTRSRHNFLYLIDHETKRDAPDQPVTESRSDLLFRAFHFERNPHERIVNLLYYAGFYYRKELATSDYRFDVLASLYGQKREGVRFSWHLFPLLFYAKRPDQSSLFAFGLYRNKTPTRSRYNFLYLIDRETQRDAPDQPVTESRSDLLFRAFHFEKNPRERIVNLLYYAGLYYRRELATSDYRFDVLASLYGQKREGEYFSCHLFPLFFYAKEPGQSTLFAFGLYRNKTPTRSRHNFLYLIDHEKEGNHNRFSMVFGAIRHDGDDAYTRFRFLYGLGFKVHKDKHGGDYAVSALAHLIGATKHQEERRSHFFPVYYYKKNSRAKRFLFPILPAIAYYNASDSRSDRVILSGLYYHLEKIRKNQLYAGILWGALYYHNRKPKRGYESRGSLWGLLWKYEKESETGFRQFSLLKFVFSKTRTVDGKNYMRILGVRIRR